MFGYGSLMWRPGFPYVDRQSALLHGRRRAFCIYSVHHRGTPERRGLVLGLLPGGAVRGAAYRIAPSDWNAVQAYLAEREHPSETYVAAQVRVRLPDGSRREALTYLSDTRHPQWAGALSLDEQTRLIVGATGLSGRNMDYLRDLVAHLEEEGVHDHRLKTLLTMAERASTDAFDVRAPAL